MRGILAFALICLTATRLSGAGPGDEELIKLAGTRLKEILGAPGGIPPQVLHQAECVLIFPSAKTFGFGSGAGSAKGAMTCRTGEHFRGDWSPPAIFVLQSGPYELRFIDDTTDFVLFVMNPRAVDAVLRGTYILRYDPRRREYAAAPGPVGDSPPGADREPAAFQGDILIYRSSQAFIQGVALPECVLRSEDGAHRKLYGRRLTARQITRGNAVSSSGIGREIVTILNQWSR